jgi:hypothetical protein
MSKKKKTLHMTFMLNVTCHAFFNLGEVFPPIVKTEFPFPPPVIILLRKLSSTLA